MKNNKTILILLFMMLLSVGQVFADFDLTPLSNPDREEVIDEVSRFTGVTKDTLDVIFKESPAVFDKMSDTVFGVKIVNMLSEAKDTDALSEVVWWRLGKVSDSLLKKVLPSSANTFITVLKVYYSALEIIKEYIVIPKFDTKMYNAYKNARGEHGNDEEAFSEATTQGFSGYYMVRDKMYEEMIKSKGYNKEVISEKMEKDLKKKIDKFWMDRMEAKYQQDIFKQNAQKNIKDTWKMSEKEINQIKKRAAELESKYPKQTQYFLKESDIPSGFKLVKLPEGKAGIRTEVQRNNNSDRVWVNENMVLYNSNFNEVMEMSSHSYYSADRKYVYINEVHLFVSISNRKYTMTFQGKNYPTDEYEGLKRQDYYKNMPYGYNSVAPFKNPKTVWGYVFSGQDKSTHKYNVLCLTKKWYINVYAAANAPEVNKNAFSGSSDRIMDNTVPTREFIEKITSIILDKIPAGE